MNSIEMTDTNALDQIAYALSSDAYSDQELIGLIGTIVLGTGRNFLEDSGDAS